MKVLSIAVPCYNSEAYMDKCINSLLVGGEDVEILIVNDGSTKDHTAEIADSYERRYPTICRALHQENKGHGGAVNTGLANANGVFFKVVDSDDCVNPDAYKKILAVLKSSIREGKKLDMMISNFVYDKEGAKHKKSMRYTRSLPQNRYFGWDDTKKMPTTSQILMHSLIYRTEVLRECGLKLPEHTFYVDNLVAFVPFPYVKTMYYLDVDFYMYYIGRSDQSVNEKVMIGRIDQQMRVNRLMAEALGAHENLNPKTRSYMVNYLTIISCITSILAFRSEDAENLKKKEEVWEYMKEKAPLDYKKIRYSFFGIMMNVKSKPMQKLVCQAYHLAQKLYGFN